MERNECSEQSLFVGGTSCLNKPAHHRVDCQTNWLISDPSLTLPRREYLHFVLIFNSRKSHLEIILFSTSTDYYDNYLLRKLLIVDDI